VSTPRNIERAVGQLDGRPTTIETGCADIALTRRAAERLGRRVDHESDLPRITNKDQLRAALAANGSEQLGTLSLSRVLDAHDMRLAATLITADGILDHPTLDHPVAIAATIWTDGRPTMLPSSCPGVASHERAHVRTRTSSQQWFVGGHGTTTYSVITGNVPARNPTDVRAVAEQAVDDVIQTRATIIDSYPEFAPLPVIGRGVRAADVDPERGSVVGPRVALGDEPGAVIKLIDGGVPFVLEVLGSAHGEPIDPDGYELQLTDLRAQCSWNGVIVRNRTNLADLLGNMPLIRSRQLTLPVPTVAGAARMTLGGLMIPRPDGMAPESVQVIIYTEYAELGAERTVFAITNIRRTLRGLHRIAEATDALFADVATRAECRRRQMRIVNHLENPATSRKGAYTNAAMGVLMAAPTVRDHHPIGAR
jgi:hypothetical protein